MTKFGTWDFKWPQRTQIRFAFQRLPPEVELNLEALIRKFAEIANAWLPEGNSNVGFDFSLGNPRLLAAPSKVPVPAGVEANGRRELYSAESYRPGADPYVDYDVLVSFAPLPVLAVPPRRPDGTVDQRELVTGQVSVLGAYARRAEYGSPTTLVGPNTDESGCSSLADYFSGAAYRYIVLHELGHILGLAHAHQNPLYRLNQARLGRPIVIDPSRVIAVVNALAPQLQTRFFPGRAAATIRDELASELRDVWPHDPPIDGRIPYSDWLDVTVGEGRDLEHSTVMAHPGWSAILDHGRPTTLSAFPTGPGADDLNQLRLMYPPAARGACAN